MSGRERKMAIVLGLTLGGLGLAGAVRFIVIAPLDAIKSQIKNEKERQGKLQGRLRELSGVEQEWQALAGQTLADDAREAQIAFREKLHGLLERHGLSNDPTAKDTKISPGAAVRDKAGFVRVPLTITTSGTLKEVVGFLCDFYRQGFLARLDRVTLAADQAAISDALPATGGAGRGKPGARPAGPRKNTAPLGPDGPELTVTMTATTLVLPRIKNVKAASNANPEEDPNGRLPRDRLVYNNIFEKNPFRPYQPPPPPPPKVDPPAVTSAPVEPPKAVTPLEPPKPVRPDAPYLCARILDVHDGQPVVYVYDNRDAAKPPSVYQLDQPLDDGTLFMVVPGTKGGFVVRAKDAATGVTKVYFYKLGETFDQRSEVTAETHPELVRQMRGAHADGGT
jgi:hypothetical protein